MDRDTNAVGPNMNAVTDDAFLEPLTSTAILNGVAVDVLSLRVEGTGG